MPLANIEKFFISTLLKPEENDERFLSELLPLHSINKKMQISIYRNNVSGAHERVLSQVYPACYNILGEDYFNQLCMAYRFEYPSTNADLNNYGQHFFKFIRVQTEQRQELTDLEYLPELAHLEWCWHKSYYVDNAELFSFEELALVSSDLQDRIFFRMNMAFSLHSTIYPLLDIWDSNKNMINEVQEFQLPDSENYFCISRKEFTPAVDILDYESYKLLSLISNGTSLLQLAEMDSVYTVELENKLMFFIQKGWVASFYLQC